MATLPGHTSMARPPDCFLFRFRVDVLLENTYAPSALPFSRSRPCNCACAHHIQHDMITNTVLWVQDIPWLWDVSLVSVLAEFARVAVTAHQRRGESDAVAFWIYQLMALDTMAPEWQHVMPQ